MFSDLRILLIEDDDALRAALQTIFSVYNHFLAAASLSEAMAHLEQRNELFDLVLLDKTLPDGNGISLIDAIRKHSSRTAVVILTGDDDFHSVAACLKAGADDYVVKSSRLVPDLMVRVPVAINTALTRSYRSDSEAVPSVRLPIDANMLEPGHFAGYQAQAQKDYLERALVLCHWDTLTTSKKLGIGRSTLFKKIQDLGIKRRDGAADV